MRISGVCRAFLLSAALGTAPAQVSLAEEAAQPPVSEPGARPGQPGFSWRELPPAIGYVMPAVESDPRDVRIEQLSRRVLDLEEQMEILQRIVGGKQDKLRANGR
ncbi:MULTISPECIES: hypothetical protein [unclassified Xanthobacter]|uniref:hypothetical protein n=1 Tax=unclassified Xanthobacter TaxID=2623496 RepID=UPI001F229294|nr:MULTISPECIES: hypothetical protein [unclassified Xanthobacter]